MCWTLFLGFLIIQFAAASFCCVDSCPGDPEIDGQASCPSMASTLYLSRRIVLENSIVDGGILVGSDGKIMQILHSVEVERFKHHRNSLKIVDFGDLTISAGVVDSHVHVNEPGRTDWEGYSSATRAAAQGGVTTIVDMPLNSIPPTTTVENLRAKTKSARGEVHVDVAFWGGIIPGNQNDLLGLVEAGVVGFKCFLCPSGVDEFPGVTHDDVEIAMKKLDGSGSLIAFHAEFATNSSDVDVSHPERYATYLATHPPDSEVQAIKLVIDLAEKHKVRTHIVHLSAAEALPILNEARANGRAQLTVETCHHYLTLTAETVPDNHTEYKCSPPVREASNQQALWNALALGQIDMVVSDHSPSTPDLKGLCCGLTPDFLKAWGGIAGLQFDLSLFWTGARQRGFTLHDVTRLLSATPAKLTSLDKRKGAIVEGLDADFVVWNPDEQFVVTEEIIQHKNKATPYLGMKLYGRVHETIVRGHTVFRLEEQFSRPSGKLLLPGN